MSARVGWHTGVVTDDKPEGDAYTLVMPFIVTTSAGGPYDDAAFAAGIDCGRLWEELFACSRMGATPIARHVKTPAVAQIDLIAMQHGYRAAFGPEEVPGWRLATFVLDTQTWRQSDDD